MKRGSTRLRTRSKRGQTRKSPSESATLFPVGEIKKGIDKMMWVVTATSIGVKRWTPYESTILNGFRPLTVEYIKKHAGDKILFYEREYSTAWPKRSTTNNSSFIPTGNTLVRKSVKINGLKTLSKTTIPDNTLVGIEGFLTLGKINMGVSFLQVDSKNKFAVSSNVMNVEAFVKV